MANMTSGTELLAVPWVSRHQVNALSCDAQMCTVSQAWRRVSRTALGPSLEPADEKAIRKAKKSRERNRIEDDPRHGLAATLRAKSMRRAGLEGQSYCLRHVQVSASSV